MVDFPIKLGSREANADVLEFMRTFCPWAVEFKWVWHQRVRLYGGLDFTPAGATSQVLTLNTLFPNNSFPDNVDLVPGAAVKRVSNVVGTSISNATMVMGGVFDAGTDADGLTTSSSIFTGDGYINTPAAANYARRYESDFSPTITISLTGANMTAIDEGEIELFIPWSPRRSYE